MGAVIRIVGPSMGKPNAAGSTKLAGYGFMFAGILLALSNAVTVISVGEVGVLHFLGKVDPTPLQEGVHLGSEATIKRSIVLNAMRNGVRDAIEAKQERAQEVEAERFQTEIIQQRALQAIEEAKGIAEAQEIISAGLTPAYLTFPYIEKLAELPPRSVVYVPTEGGVPLMRMMGGGGN